MVVNLGRNFQKDSLLLAGITPFGDIAAKTKILYDSWMEINDHDADEAGSAASSWAARSKRGSKAGSQNGEAGGSASGSGAGGRGSVRSGYSAPSASSHGRNAASSARSGQRRNGDGHVVASQQVLAMVGEWQKRCEMAMKDDSALSRNSDNDHPIDDDDDIDNSSNGDDESAPLSSTLDGIELQEDAIMQVIGDDGDDNAENDMEYGSSSSSSNSSISSMSINPQFNEEPSSDFLKPEPTTPTTTQTVGLMKHPETIWAPLATEKGVMHDFQYQT